MFRRREAVFAVVFTAAYFIISVATLSDYGVGWDVSEMFIGDRNLRFCLTLDKNYLDYRQPMPIPEYARQDHPNFDSILRSEKIQMPIYEPHQVWPVGPMTASITNKIFFSGFGWMGAIESRHLAAVIWLWVLLMALFAFMRHHAGFPEGVLTTLALATFPRIVAHGHFNIKDIPSCTTFTLIVLTFYVGARKRRWGWIVLSAILWGIGLAVKANMLYVPLILIPWFAMTEVHRVRNAEGLPGRPILVALLTYPLVGLFLAVLCWPYLFMDFPEHLRDYFSFLVARGYSGEGGLQSGPFVYWVTTMPVIDLLLMITGCFALAARRGEPRLRGLGLLLSLWIGITLLRVSVPGAVDFDGIRHWLEIVPAVCILVGLGGARIIRWIETTILRERQPRTKLLVSSALTIAAFTPTILWNVRNHPHQIAFFNALIGRLPGAQARGLTDSTDYWGVCTRSAIRWFNANAEPGAAVLPLIAAHTFDYTEEVWLRNDLQLIASNALSPAMVSARLNSHHGPLYVCYITRTDFYDERIRNLERSCYPITTIQVDGAPIFKIYRFERGTDFIY